jgi:hypothetical protein
MFSTHLRLKSAYRILVINPEGKRPLERVSVDGNVPVL